MSSLPKLDALRTELSLLTDPEMRAEWLIEWAGRFVPVPDRIAKAPYPCDRRVPGCESEVYVWSELDEHGGFHGYFAVENPQGLSAKALAAVLSDVTAGVSPKAASSIDSALVYELFGRSIGMGKGQGLMGMVQSLRIEAERRAVEAAPTPGA